MPSSLQCHGFTTLDVPTSFKSSWSKLDPAVNSVSAPARSLRSRQTTHAKYRPVSASMHEGLCASVRNVRYGSAPHTSFGSHIVASLGQAGWACGSQKSGPELRKS